MSMRDTLCGRPFRTPLASFDPVTSETPLELYEPHFADVALYELAAGLGEPPTAQYLRHCLFVSPSIALWRRQGAPGEQPAIAVCSLYSSLPCVAIYFCQTHRDDLSVLDMWVDGLQGLVTHVMRGDATLPRLFAHVALPVADVRHDAFMTMGWERWGTRDLNRVPERAVYGLERDVYTLYNEGVDEGDDDAP